MSDRPIIRLKLVDLMVLTGAAAASFAVARAAQNQQPFRYIPSIYRWIAPSGLCVCFWMWAVLGLRLARPRPPIRRLARQPGILACFISVCTFGLGCIQLGGYPTSITSNAMSAWTVQIANDTSSTVMIAWLTLAITGQWRPVPEWFDRAGRALGAYMLVVFLFGRIAISYALKFL
jgi:hypothetical protein